MSSGIHVVFSAVMLLLPALTYAQQTKAPSLEALRERRVEPVRGASLREMIIGQTVSIQDVATGERFEAIFLDTGIRIFRPLERRGAGRTLAERGLSSVAHYEVLEDRVRFRAAQQRYDFQMFRIGETLYGYRVEDGAEVAGWLVTAREQRKVPRYETTTALVADGIEPLGGAALRALLAGRTLTLLQRSTGAVVQVTFAQDGTRSLRDGQGRTLGEAEHYSVFQNQLVTQIEGRPAYVTIYSTSEGFLAARSIDGGRVDWELLRRE